MTTTRILGHEFKAMDKRDYDAFAGAEDNTLICYPDDCTVLLATPTQTASGVVYEIHSYYTTETECICEMWTVRFRERSRV